MSSKCCTKQKVSRWVNMKYFVLRQIWCACLDREKNRTWHLASAGAASCRPTPNNMHCKSHCKSHCRSYAFTGILHIIHCGNPTAMPLNQVTNTPTVERAPDTFKTNVYNEIKMLISAECARLFSKKDMNAKQQEKTAHQYYHGHGNIASQLGLFMQRKGNYENVFEVDSASITGRDFIVPDKFHRQGQKKMTLDLNLKKADLQCSRGGLLMSGRTIKKYAKDAVAQSKKMMSLLDEAVKNKILDKVEDEYTYHSGKAEADLHDFILYHMYNWKAFNGATTLTDADDGADGTAEGEGEGASAETAEGDDDGNQSDELRALPADWLPKGWFFFLSRGPMAEKKFRISTLGLNDLDEYFKGGRAGARNEQAKDKAASRDYGVGNVTDCRQQRGIPFGTASQLEIASVAQNQARISNEEFQGEMVKLNMIMTSKNDRVKSHTDFAKIYAQMGMTEQATAQMTLAATLMEEVKEVEQSLQELKKRKSDLDGAEVHEYLKRGRVAMGIQDIDGTPGVGVGQVSATFHQPTSSAEQVPPLAPLQNFDVSSPQVDHSISTVTWASLESSSSEAV